LALFAFDKAFFRVNIDKDYVDTDLLDMAAADDIFMVPSDNSKNLAGAGHNNVADAPCADIEFNIAHIAKPAAVPAVNDLFLAQFA